MVARSEAGFRVECGLSILASTDTTCKLARTPERGRPGAGITAGELEDDLVLRLPPTYWADRPDADRQGDQRGEGRDLCGSGACSGAAPGRCGHREPGGRGSSERQGLLHSGFRAVCPWPRIGTPFPFRLLFRLG